MLKGDGFDYSETTRLRPTRNSSSTKINSHEDWFNNRRKQFSDKNSNKQRVFTTVQPAILSTSDTHSDDPVSKCASSIERLTISVDSSPTCTQSPSNTTPSTSDTTEKERNGDGEDAG